MEQAEEEAGLVMGMEVEEEEAMEVMLAEVHRSPGQKAGLEKEQARSTQGVCFLARPGSSLHRVPEPRILGEPNMLQEGRFVAEEAQVKARMVDLVMAKEKEAEEKEAGEREAAEEEAGSEEEDVENQRTR